jgi:hypothetical protein
MGELKDVYDRWRDIIKGDPPLLDIAGTMHSVPGLSSFGRLFLLEHSPGESGSAPAVIPLDPAPPKSKRSTERGEGRAKLIAALTKHHQYDDGGCLNLEPIGNNELAKLAGVSPSTASAFFNEKFHGHGKYQAVCRDAGKLVDSLKALNGEFSPYELYGRRPHGEDDRDDE